MLPTSPVLITGVIPDEPAVTQVVAAGSGVSCGSVLPDADACGVAFRVAMDAHFASHSDGPGLGTLFNASDYPTTLDGLFDMEWSVIPIEPPQYLVSLHPEVYQQEQARVRERFESAVELAEQTFATELQRLTAHLAERLTGLHDGQPKVFRDSAIENLREFFERFRRLNIRSSPELDMLVEEAQQVITGIEPQQLRDSVRLRQMVARDFEQIQASVGEILVDRPRRNILRRGSSTIAAV